MGESKIGGRIVDTTYINVKPEIHFQTLLRSKEPLQHWPSWV